VKMGDWVGFAIPLLLTGPGVGAIELLQVAPGVYAALQPAERRFDDCNSAVIVTDVGVVVVDTQVDPQGARSVLGAIREKTDLPVRLVINTHWHSDHVQGNQVYRKAFPEAEIIHLPQQNVLVTGDLLDDLPFTGHGSPADLVDTLERLEEVDFEHVIPGHGSVRHGRVFIPEAIARARAEALEAR
jgi:glyoxylase-like metal-dependent hydrolase (beta-lactamase superfamily II)